MHVSSVRTKDPKLQHYGLVTLWLPVAGVEMVSKLKEGHKLAAYILMQRIKPASNKSVMIRAGKYRVEDTLSELGVYGVFLKVQGDIVVNECVGHLVRTKSSTSDEGGVAAGFAVLDSPYLT